MTKAIMMDTIIGKVGSVFSTFSFIKLLFSLVKVRTDSNTINIMETNIMAGIIILGKDFGRYKYTKELT